MSVCLCVSLFNQLKYYYCFFRYKDHFFSNTDTATEAKEMLMLELRRMSTGEADKQEDPGEPPVIKIRKMQTSSSLNSLFDEIAGERESTSPGLAPVGAAIQLETYLGETTTA